MQENVGVTFSRKGRIGLSSEAASYPRKMESYSSAEW